MNAADRLKHSQIARFGTFELDTESGELRKSGLRIAVQDQPLQILRILVERAGEIGSREELRQTLWPDGTFVDFDPSLNSAVNKVRSILLDVSSAPRFIETVPRTGYRFVAQVQWLEPAQSVTSPETITPAAITSPEHRSVRQKTGIAVVLAVVVFACAASVVSLCQHQIEMSGRLPSRNVGL